MASKHLKKDFFRSEGCAKMIQTLNSEVADLAKSIGVGVRFYDQIVIMLMDTQHVQDSELDKTSSVLDRMCDVSKHLRSIGVNCINQLKPSAANTSRAEATPESVLIDADSSEDEGGVPLIEPQDQSSSES